MRTNVPCTEEHPKATTVKKKLKRIMTIAYKSGEVRPQKDENGYSTENEFRHTELTGRD